MIFDPLLEPFLRHRPAAVMTRAALEYAFAGDDLDDLFRRVATTQYEHRLTFSSVVGLLAAVVTRRYASVHAAYRADPAALAASLASVYDKLNHTDPGVAEALVPHTAGRLRSVLEAWPTEAQPIAGLRLKVVDGNYLAGTDHRLAVLRGHGAAALPGMALVVRDHATGLLTELIADPDAYTNERGRIDRLLERVRPGEVWVGDRNFCVQSLFAGIAARGSYFVIRHHAQTGVAPEGALRPAGETETGRVFEQPVAVGGTTYRLVVIRLAHPTRDGETEIRLLTNLSAEQATAVAIAETYRLRWTLEASFLEVTRSVHCELATLGYPRAAILCFALALCACNAFRVVTQAVQVAHGSDHPGEEVSSYYVANEAAAAFDGLEVVIPATVWGPLRAMSGAVFAAWLVIVAGRAEWRKYRKTTRGPKKPVTKTPAGRRAAHRSTHRLLLATKALPRSQTRP
jgi:hypothetical protein